MKLKPVLIKSKNKPILGQLCRNGVQYFIWTKSHDDIDVINKLFEYRNTEAFEIYLIDPESDIEIDDWYIDDTYEIRQSVTSDKVYWESRKDYRKIIASTTSLIINADNSLPQLSEQSIKFLINNMNENGNLPEFVSVETETLYNNHRGWQPFPDERLVNYLPNEKKKVIKMQHKNIINFNILDDRKFGRDEMELSFDAGYDKALSEINKDRFGVDDETPNFNQWILLNF